MKKYSSVSYKLCIDVICIFILCQNCIFQEDIPKLTTVVQTRRIPVTEAEPEELGIEADWIVTKAFTESTLSIQEVSVINLLFLLIKQPVC